MPHNGGRSQVNLNYVQWGLDFPFLNLFKTAQSWGLADGSGVPAPDTLDQNGYPLTITNGGVYSVFAAPSAKARPGNYVVKWTGDGTLNTISFAVISGATSGLNGRAVVRLTDAAPDTGVFRVGLGIAIQGSPRITNLIFCHEDDEALINAGQVFGMQFKQRLAEAKFGVIRFLNWQFGNTTTAVAWAHRKPVDYVFYHGSEFRASLYGGVTTSAGADYALTYGTGSPIDKQTLIVKFNASADGSVCTFNLNGTGAIPIKDIGAGDLWDTQRPVAGRYGTLTYDADLRAWLKNGGDLGGGSIGIENGAPYEVMLQLCMETGTHPWFVQPHLAADPMTDFMSGLATYCRDHAPSWMVPRFEGPNELWNGGFFQTRYAWTKAKAHWGTSYDSDNWYGKVLSTMGQAVSMVYNRDRTRYRVICGVQTFGNPAPNARLLSTLYVNSNRGTPACQWATHVACANYFRDTYTPEQQTQAAADYAAADDAGKLTLATAFVNSCLVDGTDDYKRFGLPNLARVYRSWKAWGAHFRVGGLTNYEGGWSPDYTWDVKFNALAAASKNVEALYQHTLTNYNNLLAAGGGFPSCFQLSGAQNVWSVLDPDIYAPASPQWRAITAFNN